MGFKIDEDAYNRYFGYNLEESNPPKADKPDVENHPYTYRQEAGAEAREPYLSDETPVTDTIRFTAESNIPDMDKLGDILRRLLNAAWGTDWGVIAPEFTKGEDPLKQKFPVVTYDINNRETSDKMGTVKPVKLDKAIKEVVNGKLTGDSFEVYRQWFDCVVEFDFWGRTTREARDAMTNFETLLGAYAGHLKRCGISELFFLKEIPSKLSTKYVEGVPMKAIMYYIRFERITTVRTSLLKKIEIEMFNNDGTDNFQVIQD